MHRRRPSRVAPLVTAVAAITAITLLGLSVAARPAGAATAPKPRPTTGPTVVDVTTTGSGLQALIHGSGGQISAAYTTDPSTDACQGEGCLLIGVTGGAGNGGITLHPGPCAISTAPTGDVGVVAQLACPLSALGSSFTLTSDGLGNVLSMPKSDDCAPVQHFIKGGVGPDVIILEGGCYATISCGDAYDETGNQSLDTVDTLRSSMNPGIAGDCENVNGKITMTKATKATTTKKTTTKKTTTKKR